MIILPTVDSTNKHAADLLQAGQVDHGTVILAKEQTAGRGQRGRDWVSAPGLDLTASVVLTPEQLSAQEQFRLSKLVALAVHDVVADRLRAVGRNAEAVRIKWPNDVLVGQLKVAGILIRNELSGPWVRTSVVGVGLNVNSTDRPAGFVSTSLLQETGRPEPIPEVLQGLCRRMEELWPLLGGRSEVLDQRYAEVLWARGQRVAFELDQVVWYARPCGVDALGRLLVEDDDGGVQAFGLDRLRFGPR